MWTRQSVQLYNFIQIGWCSALTILFALGLVLDKNAQDSDVRYMTIVYCISTHLLLVTINVLTLSISLWCRWWDDDNNNNDGNIDADDDILNDRVYAMRRTRECIQNSVIFVWMMLVINIYLVVTMFATYCVLSGSMQFLFNSSLVFVIVLFFAVVGLIVSFVFVVIFCCSCSCLLPQLQQQEENNNNNPFEVELLNLSRYGAPTKESMYVLQGVEYQNRLNELLEEQLTQNTEINCPICYTALFTIPECPESNVTVLSCKHCYHEKCIETWVIQNNHVRCPECRQKIAQRVLPVLV